jgi:hypothetical protein
MRLPGHKLMLRGAPYTGQSCQQWPCDTIAGVTRVNRRGDPISPDADVRLSGHGHGLCECDATGPHDLTGADRRRWHDAHKAEVLRKRRH